MKHFVDKYMYLDILKVIGFYLLLILSIACQHQEQKRNLNTSIGPVHNKPEEDLDTMDGTTGKALLDHDKMLRNFCPFENLRKLISYCKKSFPIFRNFVDK